MSVDACLQAVEESGAPTVSICGGEPTIYPELPELIAGIIERKRHIYLCTNALLLDEKVFGIVPPHKRLTINVHLDGLEETHDYVCAKDGRLRQGDGDDPRVEAPRLPHHHQHHDLQGNRHRRGGGAVPPARRDPGRRHAHLAGLPVRVVSRTTSSSRARTSTRSSSACSRSRSKYRVTSTPLFLEFAAGMRDYSCSPWSTVTRTPLGWKGPCYLIGKQYYDDLGRVLERDRLGVLGVAPGSPSARTARCTRASRRRSCAICTRARRT